MLLASAVCRRMPKSAKKFYAVRCGKSCGVFDTWEECRQQVTGFPGAIFKSFLTYQEAAQFSTNTQPLQNTGKESVDLESISTSKHKKFYAVQRGRVAGVFTSWEVCQQQIRGFPAPKFKSFSTRAEAEAFVNADSDSSKSDAEIVAGPSKYFSIPEDTEPSKPKQLPYFSLQPSTPLEPIIHPLRDVDSLKTNASGMTVIYTDGACQGQGPNKSEWRAGVGVYFGPNDPRNLSERLQGLQTNNRAELTAIIRALELAPRDEPIEIRTDSMYSIRSITEWMPGWEQKNYVGIKNEDLFRQIKSLLISRPPSAKVTWTHVRGHNGEDGNEAADKLAVAGAYF